jgi:NAD-dependent deacetylase
MSDDLKTAAERIKNAQYLTVFTGAGISVESGIPPFRGESGLWNKYDPSILDLTRYLYSPEEVWPVIKQLFYDFFTNAEPNGAHRILAKWEKSKVVKAIITQNIDNLHQAAGSREVIEFHGNSNYFICSKNSDHFFKTNEIDFNNHYPKCPKCNSLVKPSFVFFGEQIPMKAFSDSNHHASKTDLMLVIGSTGEVVPAANVPWYAKRNGAFIIEINPDNSTFTQSITDIHIKEKASKALLEIDSLI